MKLPTINYCEKLYEIYAVPAPIRKHCLAVTEVGVFITDKLIENGVNVDRNLVAVGCMLHDAFKAVSLEQLVARPEWNYVPSSRELEVWRQLREQFTGIHETIIASDILKPEFEEFSVFLKNIGSTGNPCYLYGGIELHIVHYADWRVQFDEIISFNDRLEYLKKTYKDSWEKIGISWDNRLRDEKNLENEIFNNLNFEPDDLKFQLASNLFLN